MSNQLVIFIQSPNIDPYVNVLTHCIRHQEVNEIFFACVQKVPAEKIDSVEFIEKIGNRVKELASEYPVYQSIADFFPQSKEIESRIIWVSFLEPHSSISELKSRTGNGSLLVDITGCSKRLATDVVTSFLANNIPHVAHFELSNPVFSKTWDKSRMYHDLVKDGKRYYEYDDFSSSGSTATIINGLRKFDFAKQAIILLTRVKEGIERLAYQETQRDLYKLLGGCIAVLTALAFLIQYYGWDSIEPWTYFLGAIVAIGGFAYFMRFKKDFTYHSIYQHRLEARTNQYLEYLGFKTEEYNIIDKILTSEELE